MYACDVKCMKLIHSCTEQLRLRYALLTEGGVLNTKSLHLLAYWFLGNKFLLCKEMVYL